jgi:uncharacterized protein
VVGAGAGYRTMSAERLIVFVKAPRPGLVKSRLARALGEAGACDAYQRLARAVFRRIATLREVELRFTPEDAFQEIKPWLRMHWTAAAQSSGDLGARLHAAFTDAFAQGSTRVVIIGSDCAELEVADIQAAWRALRSHHVVLGPARDGGYWLIGLRRPEPALFREMAWSTPDVFRETVDRIRSNNLSLFLLPERSDVDTIEDWRRFEAGDE